MATPRRGAQTLADAAHTWVEDMAEREQRDPSGVDREGSVGGLASASHGMDAGPVGSERAPLSGEARAEEPGRAVAEPPTLDEAFATLRAAMQEAYVDHQPAWLECDFVQGLYNNGNIVAAWRRAIYLLEGLIGSSVRGD